MVVRVLRVGVGEGGLRACERAGGLWPPEDEDSKVWDLVLPCACGGRAYRGGGTLLDVRVLVLCAGVSHLCLVSV